MTADDALKTGLFVSVLLHATLFFGWGETVHVPQSGAAVATMELEGSGAVVSDEGGVLLEARVFDPRAADEAKAFEERRRRYLSYLQDVSNEIHARRLEAGGLGLIGICEVRFSIDEAGRLYARAPPQSSGPPPPPPEARPCGAPRRGCRKRARETSRRRGRRSPARLRRNPLSVRPEVRKSPAGFLRQGSLPLGAGI